MKYLLMLAVLVGLFSCNPPTLSTYYLRGTWISADKKVSYGFMGNSTMLIEDIYEGDEYQYKVVGDSIIFHSLMEELLYDDNVTDDTIICEVISYDTLMLDYHGYHTKLIRTKHEK